MSIRHRARTKNREPHIITAPHRTTVAKEVLRSQTETEKLRVIRSYQNHPSAELRLDAAGAMLEIARRSKDISKQMVYFDEARVQYERLAQSSRVGERSIAGRAEMTHINFTSIQSIFFAGVIAPFAVRSSTYSDLIGAGLRQTDSLHRMRDWDKEKAEVIGNVGEIAVMLLLQRFGLQDDCEDSWAAVPSFAFEDKGTGKHFESSTWDISVFTQYDRETAPERNYKVQVKASDRYGKVYDEDISQVHVYPDLYLGNEDIHAVKSGHFLSKIIAECAIEQEKGLLTERLDARTEKLLDILG